LLNFAEKKRLFLCEALFKYEKIKFHEYIIDISLYSRQYFYIHCMNYFSSFNIFNLYQNFDCIIKLILINIS